MYRIHQIRLRLHEQETQIPQKILKKLGRTDLLIQDWKIVRASIDARNKAELYRVYTVDFLAVSKKNPQKQIHLPVGGRAKIELAPDMTYQAAVTGPEADALDGLRPVVVGMGPAGLFCALTLAKAGYQPLVIERGKDVDSRQADVDRFWTRGELNPESNVQFGEGGAGAFSDGKLTTGIRDVRIHEVLRTLAAAGGPAEITWLQHPHIGTDLLCKVVKRLREEIIALGGEVKFSTRLEKILFSQTVQTGVKNREETAQRAQARSVMGIEVQHLASGERERIPCRVLVLAIGHSARDTFRMLRDCGVRMSQKPFSIGVRIEHPQDLIDKAQYGKPARELGLPVATYKLSYRCRQDGPAEGRGVYTFCMCPGGRVIVASSQTGGVVTNGMSYHERNSGMANSALLCDVRVSDFDSDDVLAGVELQEKYERLAFALGGGGYRPPSATWGALRDGRAPHVEGCLPDFAMAAFREAMPELGKKLKGFDSEEAVVTAVESRSSSPVRFARGETLEGELLVHSSLAMEEAQAAGQSTCRFIGFYPCGEGAGYAGGITSAAVDGMKVAEAIIRNWRKR